MQNNELNELNEAITKLQDIYDQGLEIKELLELGPSGQHGGLEKAAKEVSENWECTITKERARKAVEFVKEFTSEQRKRLVSMCIKGGFCPEFGTVVRLFPLEVRDRNRILKRIIAERWTKADLDAELELLKPSGTQVDSKRRGRQPKAAKSLHALKGQAAVDSRRWAHILDLLQHDAAEFKITKGQVKDLKALTKLLGKISKWKS